MTLGMKKNPALSVTMPSQNGLTNLTLPNHTSDHRMITSKAQMLKIIGTTAMGHVLTREEKFQVFCKVCDNALEGGHITKANHTRWTNVF